MRNCDVSLVGVCFDIQGNNNTVQNCSMQNLRMVVNDASPDNDYGANPVVITGANNSILNNYFKDCWANSIDYGYDGGGVEIYGDGTNNNIVMYNTAINCNGFMEFGSGNGGTSNDNVVAYNLMINCVDLLWINNSGQYKIAVNNLQINNNVILITTNQLSASSQMIDMAASSSIANIASLKNNIFWLTTGIDVVSNRFTGVQLTHQNNIYHLGSGSTLGFTLGGSELSTSAPLFTNTSSTDPTAWNYSPIAGSPAINFGQALGYTKDFANNSIVGLPDAGILESGSSTPAPLTANSTAGTISCNGTTTTVTVSASGGTAPYTGTGTFTVAAGTFNYTVKDATGATATTSITVTQPTQLVSNSVGGIINIFGGTTSITVTASGGTQPYTYSLNGGTFQTSKVFNNILAGIFSMVVKDANGCTVTNQVTVSQPSQPAPPSTLIATASASEILCNAGTATVTVTASGGTAPYTGTGTFSVTAGTYNYTVKDAAGQTATTSVTVSQPNAITESLASGTISIYGGSTTITVTAGGGTPGYTYMLDNGSYNTSNIFNNILAGTYTITVKDSKGCTNSKSVTITQPAATPMILTVASSAGNISCNGSTTTVTVVAAGGTAPYTGTGTFTVTAGTYNYTVKDAAGQTATTTVTVSQPNALSEDLVSGTISVYGGSTTITVTAGGGTPGYTYKLNSGTYKTSNIFNNIQAGTYTVTVKDSKGCTTSKSITITQPAEPTTLTAASSAGDISCNGGNTTVTVTAAGGTGPYTGTGSFTVIAGTYNYTVKDAMGQSATTTITVTQPNALNVTATSGTISVNGGTTTITLSASGGTPSYQYKIDNGDYQSSNIFNNVSAGTYTVTLKDDNGCSVSKNITITQPAPIATLTASASSGIISCNASTTTITVTATGGTSPYTGTGTFTVTAGTYNYTVKDSKGTIANTSVTVTEPSAISVNISSGSITTYGGTATVTVTASGGKASYTYKMDNGSYQGSNTFINIFAGTYNITVKDINGCTSSKSITITQPAAPQPLTINVSAGAINCNGGSTSVNVTATGGTIPYSGTGTFTKTAGTYSYTVTDASGNKASKSVTISQPTLLNASFAVGSIALFGGTTSVNITASGGTVPYTYSMSASSYQSSNVFTSVGAGSYTIVVKDAKGCTTTKVISVTQPSEQIALKVTKKDAGCQGGYDGTVEASIASGGTGPYQYSVNDGEFTSSNQFANLKAGTYKISVKDSKGLVSSSNVNVGDGLRKCKTLYLTAFPNPTTTEFSLSIESDDSKNDVKIMVINMSGQRVYNAIGKINQVNTFGKDFKSGAYILRVVQGSYTQTIKLIKIK